MKLNISPTLIIAPDAGRIISDVVSKGFPLVTGTADEIYENIYSLRHAQLSNPLVVGDINPAITGKSVELKLLKVLEEINLDIMFVSSVDCFSIVFLSRFMQILKNINLYRTQGNSKTAFIQLIRGDITEPPLTFLLREAPAYAAFYYGYKKCTLPVKNKLLEFI